MCAIHTTVNAKDKGKFSQLLRLDVGMYAEVAMIGALLVAYSVPCETTICNPGTFAKRNSTDRPDGSRHAALCQRCSNCTKLGRIELEHCTSYFDAKCGCEDGYIESTDNPERCVRGPTSPPEIFSGYRISQFTIIFSCLAVAVVTLILIITVVTFRCILKSGVPQKVPQYV